MPMTMIQERKDSQSFMLNFNVKEEFFEYFTEEEEEDHLTISQYHSRRSTLHSPPLVVEQRQPLETHKDVFKAGPTHKAKRKVLAGHPQTPKGCKRKSNMFDNCDDPQESSVENQIKEIQENLGVECPIFVKSMIHSNVTRWFCVTLPKEFCHLHLPLHDTTVTLEDESGQEYRTKFLVGKRILSSGWKMFCIENKLLVGDLLVFRLVRPLKFKVYIMGAHSLDEVDAAFSLLKFNASAKQTVFEENHAMPLPRVRDVCQGNIRKTRLTLDTNPELVDYHSEDDNEEFGSNIPKGIRFPRPVADFEDVRSIENFTIVINGVTIDSHLSKQLRTNYYDLCCSQSSFLHDHLLIGINCKLAAEIITETSRIANAIRACKLSTPHADYVMWEKTLDAFEVLGMNVGFLRARLKWLLSLSLESKESMESKRYLEESKLEQVCAKKEMRALESKYLELKEMIANLDAKVEALEEIAKRYELIFQEEANAPW